MEYYPVPVQINLHPRTQKIPMQILLFCLSILLYLSYPDFKNSAVSGVPYCNCLVFSSRRDCFVLFKLPFPFSWSKKLLPALGGNLGECNAYLICFLYLTDKSLVPCVYLYSFSSFIVVQSVYEGNLIPAIPYLKGISSEYTFVYWKCFQHVNISSNCHLGLLLLVKSQPLVLLLFEGNASFVS